MLMTLKSPYCLQVKGLLIIVLQIPVLLKLMIKCAVVFNLLKMISSFAALYLLCMI